MSLKVKYHILKMTSIFGQVRSKKSENRRVFTKALRYKLFLLRPYRNDYGN